MKVTKTGKYLLNAAFSSRGTCGITHLPKGAVIEITQIDHSGCKVIGPELMDWESDEIPCDPIPAAVTKRGEGK